MANNRDDAPRRGRPPKAAQPTAKDAIALDRREANQTALANTLALVNNLACAVVNANHLALEDSEALLIADAFLAVTDELDISVSPLTQALINAGTTLAFVYGSKIAIHKMTQGSTKQDEQASNQAG